MNRSALNAKRIGSGSSLPWITVAATQVLRLVGSAKVYCVKKLEANQTFTLTTSISAFRYVSGAISGVLSLVGSATAAVWQRVYFAATQNFKLSTSSSVRRRTPVGSTEVFSLASSCAMRVLHPISVAATQALQLVGDVTLYDLTTTPAPAERTAGIVDITTRVTSEVVIGEA